MDTLDKIRDDVLSEIGGSEESEQWDRWLSGLAARLDALASALRQVERETLERIDIERLAAIEHEQWAHWTKYMLGNLTADNIARWKRQIDTGYSDLSESEKESDRRWAYRVVRSLSANELPTTQELADEYVRVPRLKLTETDQSLDMHISDITRREARDIAEMLGGGAVVWHEDKCYPTTDVECTIQAAEKGE